MPKRRAIVILHPDFDPDTKEAVELAAEFCKGMREVGRAMMPHIAKDLTAEFPEIDLERANEIALGYQYKVMKVEI
jgi:hypothetical protein